MKSNILPLAAALTLISGCIVVSDGVDAGDPLDAQLYLDWDVRDVVTDDPLTCATVGADTIRVKARNASTGKSYVDLFDCSAFSGTTYSLTAGDYYVTVDIAYCGTDPACSNPDVLSSAATIGPLGVWDDGEIDLGSFVFRL
jgi:hypothetical protein